MQAYAYICKHVLADAGRCQQMTDMPAYASVRKLWYFCSIAMVASCFQIQMFTSRLLLAPLLLPLPCLQILNPGARFLRPEMLRTLLADIQGLLPSPLSQSYQHYQSFFATASSRPILCTGGLSCNHSSQINLKQPNQIRIENVIVIYWTCFDSIDMLVCMPDSMCYDLASDEMCENDI